MSTTAADPALAFWLAAAAREGALSEASGGATLVVLPPVLQEVYDLPEEVTVTSEPEIAREDGALLLIPGHPVLRGAADRVLARGDVGYAHLSWPASRAPRVETLVARAREQLPVDHGRIDPGGEPAPVYLPVLRVGARVAYGVSLDERFEEVEEVWVDGRSGMALDDAARRGVGEGPWLPGLPSDRPGLEPDLVTALVGAHSLLERRAEGRLGSLAGAARQAMHEEQAQAEVFYEAALASLAGRQTSAGPERRAMYDARMEATRHERARRLGEIEEKYRASHEIRPFRLHVVLVPGLLVPVTVRRGARTYPLVLPWFTVTSTFAPFRCPDCGEAAPLVAGRDRLGCRACLSPIPSGEARAQTAAPANDRESTSEARLRSAVTRQTDDAGGREAMQPEPPAPAPSQPPPAPEAPAPAVRPQSGESNGRASARPRAGRRRPARPSGRVTPRETGTTPRRVREAGDRLGLDFWNAVAGGERWPRKRVAPHSPLDILYRLYGSAGPAVAIGLPARPPIAGVLARTADPWRGLPEVTTGFVAVEGERYSFSLRWRFEGAKPVLLEVVPFLEALDAAFPPPAHLGEGVGDYLCGGVPPPASALDPVASVLFAAALPLVGLPLVTRCLAAWSRLCDGGPTPSSGPEVIAAALIEALGAVAKVAGAKQAARALGADPDAVALLRSALRRGLRLSEAQPW